MSPKNRSTKALRFRFALALALVCSGAVIAWWLRSAQPVTSTATARSSQKNLAPDASVVRAETPPLPAHRAEQDQPAPETIEALATHDHSRALTLALRETNTVLRQELLQAVLRGWARIEADAAADWTLTQTHLDQGLAMAAVFNRANRSPDTAIRLARRLSAQHPENADSYGSYLIFSLAQIGRFELGADFASASAADLQPHLLTAAYAHWSQREPERAMHAALALIDPAKQDAAFQAAIGGWARVNPEALTSAALQFPEGPDRTLALTTGLRSWIAKNPATAADWIAQHKLSAKEAAMVLEE